LDNATHNKSLDASGGSVFRIMTGPAMLELNRAAASTQPFGVRMYSNISYRLLTIERKETRMPRRLIIMMITVVTLAASVLVFGCVNRPLPQAVARGGEVVADGGVIKAEVRGRLHFQEGQGYFISVKSREHPGGENRVWLFISENKVLVRKLDGLVEKNVTANGELEQMPENVRAIVPPHGMYLRDMPEIEEAK
jgi:hypothetical protein